MYRYVCNYECMCMYVYIINLLFSNYDLYFFFFLIYQFTCIVYYIMYCYLIVYACVNGHMPH